MRALMAIGLMAVLAVGVAAQAPATAPAELKVGDAAPSFSMQASDGQTYTLDQFKGKKAVVIAWYPKSFTGGCTKECKSMKTYGAELKALNVAYFTASCDPVDVQKKFAESLEVDYPILADPSKDAAKAFGVSDVSTTPSRMPCHIASWSFFTRTGGFTLARSPQAASFVKCR